jgi:tape measure domain-containing protein
MASEQSLVLRMRSEGAQTFAAELREDATQVRGLGTAAEGAGRRLQTAAKRMDLMGSVSKQMGRNVRAATGLARNLGFGVLGLGAYAAKTGVQFDAMLQSQTVAFSGFLGSTKAARAYLGQLYTLAAKTPFEFSDVLQGSRNLMAYGMSAKGAMTTLTGLGNAIAATGGGAEQIQRATTAAGQIQAAGIVHAQDLNQLIQAGVVSVPRLAKRFGESSAQFRDQMASGKVTATKFFAAMNYGWQHDPMYKGAAAKQAKTFQGQLSSLHDYAAQTLGTITQPLFDALSRDALPRVVTLAHDANRIWDRNISFHAKIDLTERAIKRDLGPLEREFATCWQRNDVGGQIEHGFESTLTTMANTAGREAPTVAKAFVNGWLHAGIWGKAAMGAAFLKYTGLGGALLKGAGGLLKGKGGVAGKAGVVPVYVVNLGPRGLPLNKQEGSLLSKVLKGGGAAALRLAPATAEMAPILAALGIPVAAAFYDRQRKPTYTATHQAARVPVIQHGRHAAIGGGGVAFNPAAPYTRSTATGVYTPGGSLVQRNTDAYRGYKGVPTVAQVRANDRQARAAAREAAKAVADAFAKRPIEATLHSTLLLPDGQVLAKAVHREAVKAKSKR